MSTDISPLLIATYPGRKPFSHGPGMVRDTSRGTGTMLGDEWLQSLRSQDNPASTTAGHLSKRVAMEADELMQYLQFWIHGSE